MDYKEEVFDKIRKDYEAVSDKFETHDIRFVPISALNGDNVVDRSTNMDWYDGPTLMYLLENIHIASDRNLIDPRFPVQYVVRPQSDEYHDYRGYAGRVAGGVLKKGDNVVVLPSGLTSKIAAISTMTGEQDTAFPPQSVAVTLEDDIDISRGDMIVAEDNQPQVSQDITIMFCWLNEKALVPNGKYTLRHTTNDARCVVKSVDYKVDVNTLDKISDVSKVGLNEIGQMKLRSTRPLMFDSYNKNRVTGSVILIDEGTNETVCAGMIV